MRAPLTIVPPAVTPPGNQFCVGAISSEREEVMATPVRAMIVLEALGSRSTATVHEWCSVSIAA